MKRFFVLALGAIALLGAGSVVFILVATHPAPSRGSIVPEPRTEPVAVPVTPAPQVAPAPGSGWVLGRPPPVPMLPPPAPDPVVEPPRGSWEAVNPIGRPSELGPIGPPVMMALRGASAKLTACFDYESEARFASSGKVPRASADPGTGAVGGPPVLMLELETSRGAVRIVDAPVESPGSAGDGVILCAQEVLRGLRIPAPQARPGLRYRMPHALTR